MRETTLLKKSYVPKVRSRFSILADTRWYKSYFVPVSIPPKMNLTLVILIAIYHTKPYGNTNDYFIYV
jgi:hypothetical protein